MAWMIASWLAATSVADAQFSTPTLPPPPAPPSKPAAGPPQATELRLSTSVALEGAPAAQAGIAGSTAYVPLKDGRLVAVDLELARVKWSVDLPTTLPPVAGDDAIFVAGDERLTAIAPDSTIKWTLPLAGGFSAPPYFAGGWLIVGAASGDVLCLRASDGHVLWTRHFGSTLLPGAAISGDRLYLGFADGTVAAHALTDGTPIWDTKLGGPPGPILALDDRLFVGSQDRFFYCLKTENGKRRWRFRIAGPIVGLPAVDDERVYFVALDNVLRALDRFGGSQRWKVGLPLRPSGGPLLMGAFVAVAGTSAEVRTYVAATGKEGSRYAAPRDLAAAPQVLVGAIPEFSAVLLLSREGVLELLRRRLEPDIVPLDHAIGAAVPFDAPPPTPTP
jgi:outer membrane protein assembly factor BamB